MNTKVCTRCKEEKSVTEFYRKQGKCRPCCSAYMKAWNKKKREGVRLTVPFGVAKKLPIHKSNGKVTDITFVTAIKSNRVSDRVIDDLRPIVELISQKLSHSEIAQKLGKSPSTIKNLENELVGAVLAGYSSLESYVKDGRKCSYNRKEVK